MPLMGTGLTLAQVVQPLQGHAACIDQFDGLSQFLRRDLVAGQFFDDFLEGQRLPQPELPAALGLLVRAPP